MTEESFHEQAMRHASKHFGKEKDLETACQVYFQIAMHHVAGKHITTEQATAIRKELFIYSYEAPDDDLVDMMKQQGDGGSCE